MKNRYKGISKGELGLEENEIDELCYMLNLTPKRTGLLVDIWAEHGGVNRKQRVITRERVMIGTNNYQVSVSISSVPELLDETKNIKDSEIEKIRKGMDYIAKNADLFLKHYNDKDGLFDDFDLMNALRKRGFYKV